MKKIIWIIGILFVIFSVVIIGIVISQSSIINVKSPFTNSKKSTATINSHTINLYIAKSPQDQQVGLSKYDSLPKDSGMLFIFENPDNYTFWMKDMKFPIDIIFIKDNRIVTIYNNVPPPKDKNDNLLLYQSKTEADKVLEINAGLAKEYNLKEGDTVKLNI